MYLAAVSYTHLRAHESSTNFPRMLYPLLPLPKWDVGGGQEEKTYRTILYESNRYGFARAYYDSKTVE